LEYWLSGRLFPRNFTEVAKMPDLTEKPKDDIQTLKDKVTRHEQYFRLAGALAIIFGLTGAYGWNALQTLRQQVEDVHDPSGQ
jgi:hypothetical protein